ncbi:hypothetical protein GWK08_00930 [Leptobacterium flavescens]|uniref:Uncharacterized protein n=1 Tax=Leptobacterium flavescens TaxID=472055 RepID=A0A6P0UFD9_9FLAO|nr:hypothetical protein [Leptobacterium flavescens]NER11991.1 hypothetical protein [Leptobacterium flavescens]
MSSGSYNFDAEKIAGYLRRFVENLPKVYSWTADLQGLNRLEVLSYEEIYELNQLSLYEKEVKLKFILRDKLQENFEYNPSLFNALCMWIIRDWGGIKGAKEESTIPSLIKFINSEKPAYDRLPSLSKAGMFMFPEKNIIYDSRVIYSLNWVLLSQEAGSHFFPIPGGRNSKMNAFDMNVLIRLFNAEKYKPEKRSQLKNRNYISEIDKSLYVDEKDAYFEAISLIKKVNQLLWDDERSEFPFYTEMILFSAADVEIFHDITSKLKVRIS